jgi:hypothetical protein
MPITEQLTERQGLAPAGSANPNAGTFNTPGTLTSLSFYTAALNMGLYRRARAILKVGVNAAGNLALKLQSSTAPNGVWADITTATAPGTAVAAVLGPLGVGTGANGIYTIEIRADQMPLGQPWLRAIVTESAAGSPVVDLTLIGDDGAYHPAATQPAAFNGAATPTANLVL